MVLYERRKYFDFTRIRYCDPIRKIHYASIPVLVTLVTSLISIFFRLVGASESNYMVPKQGNRISARTFICYFQNLVRPVTNEVSVERIFSSSLQGTFVNTYRHVNRQGFNVKCFLLQCKIAFVLPPHSSQPNSISSQK
jgi:hypothetical protein